MRVNKRIEMYILSNIDEKVMLEILTGEASKVYLKTIFDRGIKNIR